jgi:transcriptional regulator with XRE-family HTH domain
MSVQERNKTVAAVRGDNWKTNLVKGRLQAQIYPSALKLIRVRKAISQHSIAMACEISVSTLGGIERGNRPVRPIVAKKIANLLGVSSSKIFKLIDKILFAIQTDSKL